MKGSIFTQEHICNDFLQQLFKWNKLAGLLLSAAPFLYFSFLCCRKCFCKFIKTEFYFLNLSLCEYDLNISSHPLQSHCIHVLSPICTATDKAALFNSFFNVMCFIIIAQKAKKMYIKYIGSNLAAIYSLVCCWWKANENFHLVIYF